MGSKRPTPHCEQTTTGPVDLKTGSGSIYLSRVSAKHCKVDTSYGTITGDDISADQFELRTSSGILSLSNVVASKLDARTSYGRMSLNECQADEILLNSSSGAINVTGTNADRIHLETSYGQIRCQDFICHDFHAKSGSGNVVIAFLPSTPHDAKIEVLSGYGRVDIAVPKAFGGHVELSTGYGSIECDLPVTIQGKVSEKQLNGTTGQGAGNLSAHTNSGNVRVRYSSQEAE